MTLIELVLISVMCYFAGYGLSAYLEDQEKEKKEKESREITKDLRDKTWKRGLK